MVIRNSASCGNRHVRYIRQDRNDGRSASVRVTVRFESLEPRRLLSAAPLDGSWYGFYAGFEKVQDIFSPYEIGVEQFDGAISHGWFDGTSRYYDGPDLIEELFENEVWRNDDGQFRIYPSGNEYDTFDGMMIGGVDPDSMVAWHMVHGEIINGQEETVALDDYSAMMRVSGEATAEDLYGAWSFDALSMSFGLFGGYEDTTSLSGTLTFNEDGSFTFTDMVSSDGAESDDGGTWSLAVDGLLELEMTDGSMLFGAVGDLGSVLCFGDLDSFEDGETTSGVAVKHGEGATWDDVVGDYRIGRVTVDEWGEPSDLSSAMMLRLYEDGSYEVFDLVEIDDGEAILDVLQYGSWDVDESGLFETFERSNGDFDLDGQFDATFTVLSGASTTPGEDGLIGAFLGTRGDYPESDFLDFTGDAFPSVAMDASGGFILTWTHKADEGDDADIYAQLYDALGVAAGDAFVVNTTLDGDQFGQRVAMDDTGHFVVVWESSDAESEANSVYGRLFNADGSAVGDEFQIDSGSVGLNINPWVAMDADGDFVVTWSSLGAFDTDGLDILARGYDADGTPRGDEFIVHEDSYGEQDQSSVAVDSVGNFVVVWLDFGLYGEYDGIIYGRLYDSTGDDIGASFEIAPDSLWSQDLPVVGMNDDSEIVVTWAVSGGDGDGYTVMARSFDGAGNALGDKYQVNSTYEGDQDAPAVGMNDVGEVVVGWTNWTYEGETTTADTRARWMQSDGTFTTGEFLVDSEASPDGDCEFVTVDISNNGNTIVAWTGFDTVTGDAGIYFQLFEASDDLITVDAGDDVAGDEGDLYYFFGEVYGAPLDGLTISWDFGDGSSGDGLDVVHMYADDGEYTAVFTVTDEIGDEYSDSVQVSVSNVDPFVDAGDDLAGEAGDMFVFDGWADDPGDDTLTYIWDFGDGNGDEGVDLTSPTHVYFEADEYLVTLTVRDEDGGTMQDTLTVSVDEGEVIYPDPPTGLVLSSSSDTGESNSDGITSENETLELTITGVTNGAIVRLFADGELVAEVTAGSTTVKLNHAAGEGEILVDGWIVYTATQTVNGVESDPSDLTMVLVVATAPVQPGALTLEDDPDGNGRAWATDLTFSGTAEPLTAVELFRNGQRVGESTVAEEGGWTVVARSAPLGVYEYTVRLTDTAGNESDYSEALVVNKVKPTADKPDRPVLLDEFGEVDEDGLSLVSQPTFSGTAVVGDLVRVYSDGVLVGQGFADEDGNWEITSDTELTNDKHTIQVTQAYSENPDASESVFSSSLSITVDTGADQLVAPRLKSGKKDDTGRSNTDGTTNNTKPTFEGEGAEKKATVILYDQFDNEIGRTTANASGKWKITPVEDLLDGAYSMTVIQIDTAGNESIASDPLELVIDLSAPDEADAPDLSAVSDTGVSNDDDVTASRELIFTGTAEVDSEVQMQRNGKKFGPTTIADEDGNWTITITNAPAKVTEWSIKQTDTAGNEQVFGDTLSVEVITKKPKAPKSVALAEGEDTGTKDNDRITNVNTPTITGTADAGNTITLYATDGVTMLGTEVVDEDGNWAIDVVDVLIDGEHQLKATQIDLVGNTSSMSKALKVTVDTNAAAPDVPALKSGKRDDTGRSNEDGITNNTKPRFEGEGAEKKATVILYDQFENEIGRATANGSGKWKITPVGDLEGGVYQMTVVQIDTAGNESVESVPMDLVIDLTAPTPAFAPDLDASTDDGVFDDDNITSLRDLLFTGQAEAYGEIQLMRNGKKYGSSVIAGADGLYSVEVFGVAYGVSEWSVQVMDLAGNTSEIGESISVEVIRGD